MVLVPAYQTATLTVSIPVSTCSAAHCIYIVPDTLDLLAKLTQEQYHYDMFHYGYKESVPHQDFTVSTSRDDIASLLQHTHRSEHKGSISDVLHQALAPQHLALAPRTREHELQQIIINVALIP